MKIMTILGTRPEIIRLSLIIKKLDALSSKHILIHTGQNFDRQLSDIFFEELGLRQPDYHLQLKSHSFGQQLGDMFSKVDEIINQEKPDKILVLGDTNSALCAILAERKGIPIYHMEAGNRCYDLEVPEEINRKLIDSISSFNLPYTPGSRENLLREGIPSHRIWVSGNPIYEVLQHYHPLIERSQILDTLSLKAGKYILVTCHRAENVDHRERLAQIMKGLDMVAERLDLPIICSIHPRTKERLSSFFSQAFHPHLQFHEPFGFFDFIKLQKNALCVVTDSGTVQEESCIYGVPAVTIRRSTERPETITCGSNVLSGLDANQIASSILLMSKHHSSWTCPEGYLDPHVSSKIVQFLLGGLHYV